MNQEEIEDYLNDLLEDAEDELDQVFLSRLKEMKQWLSKLFEKYPDPENNSISRTEVYKYRRFEKELQMIKENIHSDYKAAYAIIFGLMSSQYTQNYLRTGHLFEMSTQLDMAYQIPKAATIKEAITNPIKEITLNSTLNKHRNETIRRIRIELAQGIQAGEGYSTMAKRLEGALGFSRRKARTVARTEAGRSQSLGRLHTMDKVKETIDDRRLDKSWLSSRDTDVRHSHRKLDGQLAGKDGLFEYKGHKAPAPSLFGVPWLDIQCRCDTLYLVNGEKPELMRVRDYTDARYQQRLADRTEELMADEALTEKQAERKAKKQVHPPSKVTEYMDYDTWYQALGKER